MDFWTDRFGGRGSLVWGKKRKPASDQCRFQDWVSARDQHNYGRRGCEGTSRWVGGVCRWRWSSPGVKWSLADFHWIVYSVIRNGFFSLIDCVSDEFIIIFFSHGDHVGSWTNPQSTQAFFFLFIYFLRLAAEPFRWWVATDSCGKHPPN